MRGMKPVLGAEAGASRLLAENGPVWFVDRVAPNLGGLVIYLDAGLLDFTFVDDCELDRKLSEHQMPHDFRLYWGWHDWPF